MPIATRHPPTNQDQANEEVIDNDLLTQVHWYKRFVGDYIIMEGKISVYTWKKH